MAISETALRDYRWMMMRGKHAERRTAASSAGGFEDGE